MNCFIIPINGKFATVIDGNLIGVSRHLGYAPSHWKSGDLQAIARFTLTRFVIADIAGNANQIIEAAELRGVGVNFATVKRSDEGLNDTDRHELAAAVTLIRDLGGLRETSACPSAQTEPEPRTSESGTSLFIDPALSSANDKSTQGASQKDSAYLELRAEVAGVIESSVTDIASTAIARAKSPTKKRSH